MSEWTVVGGAYALDGGTIGLTLVDPAGVKHSLELTQHGLPRAAPGKLRGRLYWNRELVPLRGCLEQELLAVLSGASLRYANQGPAYTPTERFNRSTSLVLGGDIKDYLDATDQGAESGMRHLVREVVAYVGSEAYATAEFRN